MPQSALDKLVSKHTDRILDEESDKQKVPKVFTRKIAKIESGGNPRVISGQQTSSTGAIGKMQLMPNTAKSLRVNPYDIEQNISGGVRYAGEQLNRFGGNQRLGSAAYNAGPGAVEKAGNRVPNIAETKKYSSNFPESQEESELDKIVKKYGGTELDESSYTAPLQKPISTPKSLRVSKQVGPAPKPQQIFNIKTEADRVRQALKQQESVEKKREAYNQKGFLGQRLEDIGEGLAGVGESAQRGFENILTASGARAALSKAAPGAKEAFRRGREAQEYTGQQMAERREAANTLPSKITRAATEGAASAAIMAPIAMTGGAPAVMAATGLQQDWSDPIAAGVNTALSYLPIKAGQAIAPLASKAAAKVAGSTIAPAIGKGLSKLGTGAALPLRQEAVRRGIEGVAGGTVGAGQYAATQALLGRPIDTEEALAQGVAGAGLGAALAHRPGKTVSRPRSLRTIGKPQEPGLAETLQTREAQQQAGAEFRANLANQQVQPGLGQTLRSRETRQALTSDRGGETLGQAMANRSAATDTPEAMAYREQLAAQQPENVLGQELQGRSLRAGAAGPPQQQGLGSILAGRKPQLPQFPVLPANETAEIRIPIGQRERVLPATETQTFPPDAPETQFFPSIPETRQPSATGLKPTPEPVQPGIKDTRNRTILAAQQKAYQAYIGYQQAVKEGRYTNAEEFLAAEKQHLTSVKKAVESIRPGDRRPGDVEVLGQVAVGLEKNRANRIEARNNRRKFGDVEQRPTQEAEQPQITPELPAGPISEVKPTQDMPIEPMRQRGPKIGEMEPVLRSREEQPQAGKPVSSYRTLVDSNKPLVDKLYKTDLTTEEGKAGIRELRIFARDNKLENGQYHVDQLITQIQQEQAKSGLPKSQEGPYQIGDQLSSPRINKGEPVTVESIQGNRVFFRSENGAQGSFDVNSPLAQGIQKAPRQMGPTNPLQPKLDALSRKYNSYDWQDEAQAKERDEVVKKVFRQMSPDELEASIQQLETNRNRNINAPFRSEAEDRTAGSVLKLANDVRHEKVVAKELPRKFEKQPSRAENEANEWADSEYAQDAEEFKAEFGRYPQTVQEIQRGRPSTKTLQHSKFGEVEVLEKLPSGKLRVEDQQGEQHTIQNPRTTGNREAAYAQKPKETTDLARAALKGLTDQEIVSRLQEDGVTIPSDIAGDRAKLEAFAREQFKEAGTTTPEKTTLGLKPEDIAGNALKQMSSEEIRARLKEDGIEVSDKTANNRESLERVAAQAFKNAGEKILNKEYTEPKIVRDARERLRQSAKGSRAGSGGQQLADIAIIAGYKTYKAGMNFAEWSAQVIKSAGEKVKPVLADVWQQIQAVNDWHNGAKPIANFLLARLNPKSKASDIAKLITPNEQGHSAATKAGIPASELAFSRLQEIVDKNPNANLSQVLSELNQAAPRLVTKVVSSVTTDLGATTNNPTHNERLSGPATNYREKLFQWDNPPEGTNFRVRAHYGETENVVFDTRLEDRNTKDGKKGLFFIEGQSDLHQSGKQDALRDAQSIQAGIAEAKAKGERFKMPQENAPAAPFKNWQKMVAENVFNEAQTGNYDGLMFPKTPEQVKEIQQWATLREEKGRYYANGAGLEGETDVTPIVNRYIKEFPKMFEKLSGQKLETKEIDVGKGYVDDVQFLPMKRAGKPEIEAKVTTETGPEAEANYWNTRRVRKMPETESETLDVLEKTRAEFRAKKDAPGTIFTNHQGTIVIANAATSLGAKNLQSGFDGLAVATGDVPKIANVLRVDANTIEQQHGKEYAQPLRDLARSLDEATRDAEFHNQGRVILVDSTAQNMTNIKQGLREERFHRWQAGEKLTESDNASRLHGLLKNDPVYSKIAEQLVASKQYSDDPVTLVKEVPAKIASGQGEKYGINEEEGIRMLNDYFRNAARIIGKDALKQTPPGTFAAKEGFKNVKQEISGQSQPSQRVQSNRATTGPGNAGRGELGSVGQRMGTGIREGGTSRSGISAEASISRTEPEPTTIEGLRATIGARNRSAPAAKPAIPAQTQTITPQQAQTGQRVQVKPSQTPPQLPKNAPNTPVGFWTKASDIRKAGLLTSPKTHARNVLGNLFFQSMEEVSRIPAGLADLAVSAFTKRRSFAGPSLSAMARSTYKAATDGIVEAKNIMKTGLTAQQAAQLQVSQSNFKNPILKGYTDFVFRSLGAEDQVFKTYALNRSLESQAKIQALNDKRAGKISSQDVAQWTEHYRKNPTNEMSANAIADAEVATFQNDNKLSSFVRAGRAQIGEFGNFALDLFLPFDRTPTNIIARTLEMTPLGYGKNAIQLGRAIGQKAFTQKQQQAFVQTFGRATAGSALIMLGYALAQKGLMTGLPETDPKERAKDLAREPYAAVKAGDRWYQVGNLSPTGSLMAIGATLHRESTQKLKDESSRPLKIAGGLAQVALEQPLLRAGKEIVEDVTTPQTVPAKAGRLVGSFVPSVVSDVGGLTDKYQRQGKTFLEAAQTRIPGLRNRLPVKKNAAGYPIKTEWTDAVDPFGSRSASESGSALERATRGLDMSIGETRQQPGEPSHLYEARKERAFNWFAQYGNQLINDPEYKGMSSVDQKRAIMTLRRHIGQEANQTEPDTDNLSPDVIFRSMESGAKIRERNRESGKYIYQPPD